MNGFRELRRCCYSLTARAVRRVKRQVFRAFQARHENSNRGYCTMCDREVRFRKVNSLAQGS